MSARKRNRPSVTDGIRREHLVLHRLRRQPIEGGAAPPDAAGGRGSFTRPEDVIVVGEADGPLRRPDLHRMPRR